MLTALLAISAPVAAKSMAAWKNSTVGIHAFLTFDSGATLPAIQAYGARIDYVWGADNKPEHIAAWRQVNPDVVLSKYIPYTRDPGCPQLSGKDGPQCSSVTPGFKPGCPTCLPWWQANKPDLVLYQCDKKTPAWECFSGEGCRHESVPLDLTNPKTLEYQMSSAVHPAADAGYNAIALDNYGLENEWKACGSFSGPGGAWVQKYSAANPRADKQYTKDVLDWTKRASAAIHSAGLLVIPNYSADTLDENAMAVGNYTDGILAEGGFTGWNPVPNTTSMTTPPLKTTPEKFEAQLNFVRNGQRQGKGFYAINEWGAGPDYHLNPSGQPHNISGDDNRAIRQFVAAAFMMVNGGTAGVYLTCIQCYGGHAGGLGNMSIWPEYAAPVGSPSQAEPSKDMKTGVWSRMYTAGITIVNPTADPQAIQLPATGGGSWTDLYGRLVKDPSITLPPASGLILLRA